MLEQRKFVSSTVLVYLENTVWNARKPRVSRKNDTFALSL